VVLEARDRIGGRLHTVDLGGSQVDLGGSWIHTPDGNPMTALAGLLGVTRSPVDFFESAIVVDSDGNRDALAPALPTVDAFYDWLDQERAAFGASLSLADAIDRFLAGAASPDPRDGELARRFLRSLVSAENAWPPEDVVAREFPPNTVEYGGSSLGDYPDGGYKRILDGLAEGLEVLTSYPVAEIGRDARGVSVRRGPSGEVLMGSHAVVTVPLGVLKDPNAIAFRPDLSAERRAAIDRLGFGGFEKIILRFDEPFWSRAEPFAVLPDADVNDWLICFELHAFTGAPVLVAFAVGPAAKRVLGRPLEERVTEVLQLVRSVTGVEPPAPTDVVASEWAVDPYSRGAYSFIRLGSSRDDLERLGEPIGGRLLFAGEATGSARTGFADGAMLTGIREAKRLIGTGRVRLGRL
jgi:polyamine oxidase